MSVSYLTLQSIGEGYSEFLVRSASGKAEVKRNAFHPRFAIPKMLGGAVAYVRNFSHDVSVSYGHGSKPFRGYNGRRHETDREHRWRKT